MSIGFLLAGVLAGLVALSFLGDLIGPTEMAWYISDKGWLRLWTALIGVSSLLLTSLGAYTIKHLQEVDIGIPLTRANTADLPADESLVRASQEPTDKQADVLVRPITDVQSTPPEQLLRSANDR